MVKNLTRKVLTYGICCWSFNVLSLSLIPSRSLCQPIVAAPDGTGTLVSPSGNQIIIDGGTQVAGNLFHSFLQFNLNSGQVATFVVTPSVQNLLSRVVGGDPSLINGLIQVSGGSPNLYLMNPAGIVFGPNAALNVPASFTATTAQGIGLGPSWFRSQGPNDYASLGGQPDQLALTAQPGSILNAGTLTVPFGEQLMLVGGLVINTGVMTAPGGTITILALPSDRLVRLNQAGNVLSLDLPLADRVAVTGSQTPLKAVDLPQLLTGLGPSAVTGVVAESNGTLRLTSSGSSFSSDPGTTIVTGQISVATSQAVPRSSPQIHLLGDRIALMNAQIDASGPVGGTVLIGGNYQGFGPWPQAQFVYGDPTTQIRADGLSVATQPASGGTVILWANHTTRFYGSISAQGGRVGGNGGLVETSGQVGLDVTGAIVNTQAPQGATGTWLLDPSDITIANASTTALGSPNFFTPAATAVINPLTIQNALVTSNVSITTAGGTGGQGDIFLSKPITSVTPNRTLTLTARFIIPTGEGRVNLGPNSQLILNLNAVNTQPVVPATRMQQAITAIGAVSSTLLNLAAATYSGAVTINLPSSLTIQGASTGSTILSGQGAVTPLTVTGSGPVTLNRLTITDGVTAGTGGGIVNTGNLTILNSTVNGNQAANEGGGIFNAGTLSMVNSTVSGNQAANRGGGIYNTGTLTLASSTVTQNQANGQGNGVFNGGGATLKNTIVAGNPNLIGLGAIPLDVAGVFTDAGTNLIGIAPLAAGFTVSSLVGSAIAPINPQLAPLADNGGSTKTHVLLPQSPAIGTGNAVGAPPVDQRGVTRLLADIGSVAADPQPMPMPIPLPFVPVQSVNGTSPLLIPDSFGVLSQLGNTPMGGNTSLLASPFTLAPGSTLSLGLNDSPIDYSDLNQSSSLDKSVEAVDQSMTGDFQQYLGVQPKAPATMRQLRQTLRDVQSKLGVKSAVIYAVYITGSSRRTKSMDGGEALPLLRAEIPDPSDRLELLLVTATGEIVRRSVGVTRQEMMAEAEQFRLTAADRPDEESYRAWSQLLYRWLLQPLISEIETQKVTHIIYLMDRGIRTIPVAAMADERGFIIERYAVSIMPSLSLTNFTLSRLKGKPLLAMGADHFDHINKEQGEEKLDALPAVPVEVGLLTQKVWQGGGAAYLNESFSLPNILYTRKRYRPGILHLATHAKFNPGAPEKSYIQLWNSRIRLDQVAALELDKPGLELLVLSACMTAIGSPDAELGFAGIAALSNVKTALGSLWTVHDVGTLALMTEFYIHLETAPTRAEALRQAQLALLEGKTRVEANQLITSRGTFPLPEGLTLGASGDFKHPFFWAAFTLIGNPW